jgi:hypothetical protein
VTMTGTSPKPKRRRWRWAIPLCIALTLVVVLPSTGVDPRLVGSWELTTEPSTQPTEILNLLADGTGERLFLNEGGQSIRREPVCWHADKLALTLLNPSRLFRIEVRLHRLYSAVVRGTKHGQVRFYYQDFTPDKITLRGGLSPESIPARAPTFTMTRRLK